VVGAGAVVVEQQEVSKQEPTTARTREKSSFFIMTRGGERARNAQRLQAPNPAPIEGLDDYFE